MMNQAIQALLAGQLATWETARLHYAALDGVRVKELEVDGIAYKVQFNPARIVSSAAKVDDQSIRQRKCFLCAEQRPAEQRGIDFGGHYEILVNPFPIFPRHLTIPERAHLPQRIAPRFGDMLELARALTDYTLFYNGPRCGASAPDHAHFQAGSRGFLPIERQWRRLATEELATCGASARLWLLDDAPRTTLVIESPTKEGAIRLFNRAYDALKAIAPDDVPTEEEPMLNLLALYEAERWIVILFPRRCHRPACYSARGEARLLSSPASVDLGGVFILPVEEDFLKITAADLRSILGEVCLTPADLCRLRQLLTP